MDNKKDNKKVIIISIVLIIITIFLGIIYQLNRNNQITGKEEYFHNYKVNEVQNIYVSLREVANRYLADFVNNVVYYPEEVYQNLYVTTKEQYSTYNDFKYMIDRMKTINFLEAKVESYSDGIIDGKRSIYVIDKDGNSLVFVENSINNYQIIIK